MRSRRTRESVTSTPQRSQITPLCLMRLYFPQEHSQSRVGPKMRSQNRPPFSGLHVVGFYGEQFLQCVSRAVRFERPHFHLAETLAAVLRFSAERLLCNKRIRTDSTRVNFVRDQMAEFQHVDVADHDVLIELVAG